MRYPSEVPSRPCGRIAVRGAAFMASSRLLIQLFTWVVTIVTARVLHPYDYGILTAAASSRTWRTSWPKPGLARHWFRNLRCRGERPRRSVHTQSLVIVGHVPAHVRVRRAGGTGPPDSRAGHRSPRHRSRAAAGSVPIRAHGHPRASPPAQTGGHDRCFPPSSRAASS